MLVCTFMWRPEDDIKIILNHSSTFPFLESPMQTQSSLIWQLSIQFALKILSPPPKAEMMGRRHTHLMFTSYPRMLYLSIWHSPELSEKGATNSCQSLSPGLGQNLKVGFQRSKTSQVSLAHIDLLFHTQLCFLTTFNTFADEFLRFRIVYPSLYPSHIKTIQRTSI